MAGKERRASGRVPTKHSVRVEAFDKKEGDFSDITPALDAARSGVSFATKKTVYYLGMKVRVTYPYSASMQTNYVGKVVRIQRLDDNFQRISVHLETRE